MPMRVFVGSCEKKLPMPVVGRLIFSETIDSLSGNEAFLAIVREKYAEEAFDDPRIVGVIRLSEDGRPAPISAHPSITLSSLSEDCTGRIALLDTLSETLFVSPDITTVNRYTPLLSSSKDDRCDSDPTLPDGRMIKVMPHMTAPPILGSRWQGCLLDIAPFSFREDDLEELLFESYRDAAERNLGHSLAVLIDSDIHLTDRLRALMRASVFGELSLLLRGVLTESELICALDVFCRAFCELEIDGREFNGYLPRGLLIDTPYMLKKASELGGVDILVYDAESLARLFCGYRKTIPKEIFAQLAADICKTVGLCKGISHRVILGSATADPEFCRELSEHGIVEYFAPEGMTDNVREIFYRLT